MNPLEALPDLSSSATSLSAPHESPQPRAPRFACPVPSGPQWRAPSPPGSPCSPAGPPAPRKHAALHRGPFSRDPATAAREGPGCLVSGAGPGRAFPGPHPLLAQRSLRRRSLSSPCSALAPQGSQQSAGLLKGRVGLVCNAHSPRHSARHLGNKRIYMDERT